VLIHMGCQPLAVASKHRRERSIYSQLFVTVIHRSAMTLAWRAALTRRQTPLPVPTTRRKLLHIINKKKKKNKKKEGGKCIIGHSPPRLFASASNCNARLWV
jgi:hypothetical protein